MRRSSSEVSTVITQLLFREVQKGPGDSGEALGTECIGSSGVGK